MSLSQNKSKVRESPVFESLQEQAIPGLNCAYNKYRTIATQFHPVPGQGGV